MKVKVTTTILDFQGNPIKEKKITINEDFLKSVKENALSQKEFVDFIERELNKDDLTYRVLIHAALNTLLPGEVLSSTDKAKFYEISLKTFATAEPEYTDEQVKAIIERAEKVIQFPLHVGRLKDFLTAE